MNSKVRIIIGILIIAIGVGSLLDVLTSFNVYNMLSTYWPIALIVIGVAVILDRGSSNLFGSILILIGVFLQLEILDLDFFAEIDLSELIWPVIIIFIGIRVFMRKR